MCNSNILHYFNEISTIQYDIVRVVTSLYTQWVFKDVRGQEWCLVYVRIALVKIESFSVQFSTVLTRVTHLRCSEWPRSDAAAL